MSKKEMAIVKEETQLEPLDTATIEALVFEGNLARLTPAQRVAYYNNVCHGMGLNPATKPFGYIQLNGKLVLYALRNCTDQLMSTRGISTEVVEDKVMDDLLVVKVRAWTKDGRQTVDIGALTIRGLSGDAKANAFMKALTKAKRRAVLSLVGLSFPDETEVETISHAKIIEPPSISRRAIEAREEEIETLDAQYSQMIEDQESPAKPALPLAELRAHVLNALVGKGKPFGSNTAAAKAWVEEHYACAIVELTRAQCDHALENIPAALPELVPSRTREPGEDDDLPPPEVVDLTAKPTTKQIHAIKVAFEKAQIAMASVPQFLKFLTDGRMSKDWTRADFENLKSFLKDNYVEPA